jgi:hypothetical protein
MAGTSPATSSARDADGFYYVLDRRKEMIKYKGFPVAPAEVEAVLLEHPAVRDCGVVAKPDLACGEIPCAFVVLREGFTASDALDQQNSADLRRRPPRPPQAAARDSLCGCRAANAVGQDPAPSSFAWGSTIVSAFHVARRPGSIGWGSADVGFATSTDAGKKWKNGYLPGLTVNYEGGTYGAAADPSVAYDAKHGEWLISTLPLVGLNGDGQYIGDVAVSRSTDGLTWGDPIAIDTTHLDDKNWSVCDNTTSSPYYGNCYTEWDQAYGTGDVMMSTSSDGGQTWSAGQPSADHAGGLGGEPLVQANGTVIVPFEGYSGVAAFTSTNGGKSWNASVNVADITEHQVAGDFRDPDLPSATIDGAGNIYVVWGDCRFRSGCSSNDIVLSTSADGKTWTTPARIPIDAVSSTVDHFIAGIGADPTTSGANAHLTVVYYYYPVANCTVSTCELYVGFTTSRMEVQRGLPARKLMAP